MSFIFIITYAAKTVSKEEGPLSISSLPISKCYFSQIEVKWVCPPLECTVDLVTFLTERMWKNSYLRLLSLSLKTPSRFYLGL